MIVEHRNSARGAAITALMQDLLREDEGVVVAVSDFLDSLAKPPASCGVVDCDADEVVMEVSGLFGALTQRHRGAFGRA